jgi:hypothetical protein
MIQAAQNAIRVATHAGLVLWISLSDATPITYQVIWLFFVLVGFALAGDIKNARNWW